MKYSVVVLVVSVSYLVMGCANSFNAHVGWEAQAQRLKAGTSIQLRQEQKLESRVRTDAISRYLNEGKVQ